jgi:hypothetical protein
MLKEQIAVLLKRLEKICFDLEGSHHSYESAKVVLEATKLRWDIIKYIESQSVVPDIAQLVVSKEEE